jgi:hypothetical protein
MDLVKKYFMKDIFPRTGVQEYRDLPDIYLPVRDILQKRGETNIANAYDYISRTCANCDMIVPANVQD